MRLLNENKIIFYSETEETDKHPWEIRETFHQVEANDLHRGTWRLQWYDDLNNKRVIHYRFACITLGSAPCVAGIVEKVTLGNICRSIWLISQDSGDLPENCCWKVTIWSCRSTALNPVWKKALKKSELELCKCSSLTVRNSRRKIWQVQVAFLKICISTSK